MRDILLQQHKNLAQLPMAVLIDEQDESFSALLKKHKINAEEYKTLRKILGRCPSLAELGVFSAMWSEHCSYKSSKVHLRNLPTEGPEVVVGPGENAGVVRLSGKLCAAFKMESHNHPSYIEPYQGAATGVGGILRDVFCMGARPVANLNSLRFGDRQHPKTHYLFANVVKGVGDYGNCVGIPTVAGSVSFDSSYNGNILVNAMTVGLIHEDRIFKGFATGQHNLVVYVGSATGRDGIHGASMASDSFSSQQSGERSTVQVGDPFAEKLLMEATLEVLEKGLVVGLQDMGAAGLTSSSFEMADRAGNGLYLDLDKVPTRAKNMSAYELLLSESQERMLMCVEPGKWSALQECLKRWELPFAVIGLVTDTARMQIVRHGVLEVDVPVAPLAESAPRYERPFQRAHRSYAADQSFRARIQAQMMSDLLEKLFAEDGAKDRIYRQYDHHIGNKTVLGPEAGGAGLLWIRSSWSAPGLTHLGLAVATACNERYCAQNPLLGAAHAVAKCYRSITATGAQALAVTDCLNYGNPEDALVMGQIVDGIEGIGLACRELSTPVVSGNVSLYNQTDGRSIAPTPMIGMVGRHDDVRKALPAVLEKAARLYVLRPRNWMPTFGGSLLAKAVGPSLTTEDIPAIDWQQEREAGEFVRNLSAECCLLAARDVAGGGVLTAVCKLILSTERLGFELSWKSPNSNPHLDWFGEHGGTYLLASSDDLNVAKFNSKLVSSELVFIGKTFESSSLSWEGLSIDRARLKQASSGSLAI